MECDQRDCTKYISWYLKILLPKQGTNNSQKKLKGIQKQLEIHYIERLEHTVTQMANNVTFHLVQLFKKCFHISFLSIYTFSKHNFKTSELPACESSKFV